MDDQEQEVKDAAMKSLAKCLKSFSPEKVTSYLLPTIQKLYEDASASFKSGLAIALCKMPSECNLPKDVIISRILPIILDLIKDEDCDVRLNCSNGLINLADSIGTDLLSDSILTSLSQLTKDTQWRVREAVYTLISDLLLKFGKSQAIDLVALLFGFLEDTAAAVRSSTISKIKALADEFKADWIKSTVIKKLTDAYSKEKQGYLYRMSVIKTAVALIPYLSKSDTEGLIVPILKQAATDDIPNVKITLSRLVPEIIEYPSGHAIAGNLKR